MNNNIERITEKIIIGASDDATYDFREIEKAGEKGLNKLGQLEDIEQDINIELLTLFKAIVNKDNLGSVYFKYKGKNYKIEELDSEKM